MTEHKKTSKNKILFFGFLLAIVVLSLITAKTPTLTKISNLNEAHHFVQLDKFDQLIKLDQSTPLTSKAKSITLLFVGDIMLSRGVADQINRNQNNSFPFRYVQDFLKSADLTFGNLESPISNQGAEVGHLYSFRANPKVIDGLLAAGFDVLSLANNHSYDWGPEALVDTMDQLQANKIIPVGAGQNIQEAYRPVIINVGGRKIAFLAASDIPPVEAEATQTRAGIAWMKADIISQQIQKIKSQVDFIIVSMHSGTEYQNHSNIHQQKFAKQMIDAGANLVIGHHPHVIQEYEKYKNGYIFYSLGNFVFDQNWSNETSIGQIVEIKINQELPEFFTYQTSISKTTFQPSILLNSQKQVFIDR